MDHWDRVRGLEIDQDIWNKDGISVRWENVLFNKG